MQDFNTCRVYLTIIKRRNRQKMKKVIKYYQKEKWERSQKTVLFCLQVPGKTKFELTWDKYFKIIINEILSHFQMIL